MRRASLSARTATTAARSRFHKRASSSPCALSPIPSAVQPIEDISLGTCFLLHGGRAVPPPATNTTRAGAGCPRLPLPGTTQGYGWGLGGLLATGSPSLCRARLQEDNVSLFSAFRKWFIGHN